MVCDRTSSENEDKQGDNISGNHPVNLKKLTKNIEKTLVRKKSAQEKALETKIEE